MPVPVTLLAGRAEQLPCEDEEFAFTIEEIDRFAFTIEALAPRTAHIIGTAVRP